MRRKLQNTPKTYPRITHAARIDGKLYRTLRYNYGNCPGATPQAPHNRGENPTTCDHCYAVA